MLKILGLGAALLIIVATLSVGTFAYFSDTESRTANILTAGTIDLKVNDAEWTSSISLTNMKPGDSSSSYVFKNTGSLQANLTFTWASLAIADHADDTSDTFEFAASGTTPNPDYEMSAAEYQRLIYLTISADGGATNVVDAEGELTGVTTNGDGKISLYEFVQYAGTAATLDTGETYTVTFTLGDAFNGLGGEAGGPPSDYSTYIGAATATDWDILTAIGWNIPQADGMSTTITATLSQVS